MYVSCFAPFAQHCICEVLPLQFILLGFFFFFPAFNCVTISHGVCSILSGHLDYFQFFCEISRFLKALHMSKHFVC